MNDKMNNPAERIEDYLSGQMSPEEKLAFEAELKSNEDLSELLRVYNKIETDMVNAEKYRSQEESLKETLQTLGEKYFKKGTPVVRMNNRRQWFRVAMAAAAVLLSVVALYFIFSYNHSSPAQLADQYVKKELSHLSLTMDGAKDSLQQGMAAFNDGDYERALQIFEEVYRVHPENSDALRFAGVTYMVTKNYDMALACFDELSVKKELFSNPGLFLKAITLFQRDQPGDNEKAEQLLKQVVDQKLEGSRLAAEWLAN